MYRRNTSNTTHLYGRKSYVVLKGDITVCKPLTELFGIIFRCVVIDDVTMTMAAITTTMTTTAFVLSPVFIVFSECVGVLYRQTKTPLWTCTLTLGVKIFLRSVYVACEYDFLLLLLLSLTYYLVHTICRWVMQTACKSTYCVYCTVCEVWV